MEFDLTRATDVLTRTPAAIRALLGDLSDDWTRPNEGPDTFSAFDVVAHMADLEESDWLVRARLIRAAQRGGPEPRFERVDRFRHKTRYAGQPISAVIDDFARARAANLAELAGWRLSATDLEATGIHPSFGNVRLRQLFSTWVVHDLGHLAQISRVMAKQYRDAVGPWIEFLPVLTDRERPRS